jgi:hypothetical protein
MRKGVRKETGRKERETKGRDRTGRIKGRIKEHTKECNEFNVFLPFIAVYNY